MLIETNPPAYFHADDCRLDDFKALCSRSVTQKDLPQSSDIIKNVPLYDVAKFDSSDSHSLMVEWANNLRTGSGVVVLKNACKHLDAIDAATAVFEEIIADEKSAGAGAADHFAKAGANDRIWNSLQKLCLRSPQVFARYFANPAIDALCRAWLGPNYQMTAQVNLVRPGGQAQQAHRDYHLGFQTAEVSALYPAHVHDLSPALTLQGAIAHVDATIESGPTKLLPFSQNYRPGYAAWRLDDFRAYFEDNYIQLPLSKGDAVFFNPALFHAAGANQSKDVQRLVNLLQVSSAFGRAMESVDRLGMCRLLYPVLAKLDLPRDQRDSVIASAAEGYSFPTNLDRDPPVGGLAPETQAAFVSRALDEKLSAADFNKGLDEQEKRRAP